MKQETERILARLRRGERDVVGALTPGDLPASLAGVRHVVIGARWSGSGWEVSRVPVERGLPAGRATHVRVALGAESAEFLVITRPVTPRAPWRTVGVAAALLAVVLLAAPSGVSAASGPGAVTLEDVAAVFTARVEEAVLRSCVTMGRGQRPVRLGVLESAWSACGKVADLVAKQQAPFVKSSLAGGYLPAFWDAQKLREPEGCVKVLPIGAGRAFEVCMVAQEPIPEGT